MSSIIEYSYAQFHSLPEIPITNIVEDGEKFGTITLKIKKTNITTTPTLFLFTIDTTGSMAESAYKNVSKMTVVKQTFKSMITYLSNLETPIYIRVHSFNETVDVIVDNILITKDNYTEIISKIDNLLPDRSTNIGDALKSANDLMEKYSNENPNHQVVHIFMTDGEATFGITNENELAKIVNTSFSNNFVGFGIDHNASLLKKLSDLENSEYMFVDNMENTTMIYGETIHRYLYSAIKNAEIRIEDGLIYNWKTNTWDNKLMEPIIISEVEKIYHIKSKNVEELEIELYGVIDNDNNNVQLLDTIDMLPDLISFNNIKNEEQINEKEIDEDNYVIQPNDLSKYIFRQRTQELLFISNNFLDKDSSEINNFKTELKSFFKIMRDYMKTKKLLQDKFMITLCDDICITYRSVGTSVGLMYSASRSTSQGRQQTYNVTPIVRNRPLPDFPINRSYNTLMPPPLTRGGTGVVNNLTQEFIEDTYFDYKGLNINTRIIDNEISCEECEIDNYDLSNDITSCYANEGTLNTMRSMSQI